jgi:membrane-associated phospholipid phosphatase
VLLAMLVSLLVIGMITLGVTSVWKISLHVAADASPVTMLTILFGPPGLACAPAAALVAWARLRLRAHTPAQVMVAAVIAAAVTEIVFGVASAH